MATEESNYPTSSQSYEADDYEGESDGEEKRQPVNNNVANILARLKSSGALIRKPKKEFHCFTCKLDFLDLEELKNHLIHHVSLPSVELVKLASDDEDALFSGDDDWSDEDEVTPPTNPLQKTPQKINISEILKNKSLSCKNNDSSPHSTSGFNKLTGLGLTIINNNKTPIKTEKPESSNSDVMQRLGKLGGIKLTLKSDGNNTNTFKVVNGLRDFKTSDDEDENNADQDDDNDNCKPDVTNDSKDDESSDVQVESRISSESDCANIAKTNDLIPKGLRVTPSQIEDETTTAPAKPRSRPAVKKTPTRANLQSHNFNAEKIEAELEQTNSNESTDTVIVKREVLDSGETNSNVPLFSGPLKTERSSPTLPDSSSTSLITQIKTENDTNTTAALPTPLKSAPKSEDPVAVIEINGDSNDEDDDCCVVSTTPAPDIKPNIHFVPTAPKVEEVIYPSSTTSGAFSMPQANYSSASSTISSHAPAIPSQAKQQSFNWNLPDSKPAVDIFEKSADDIFHSLISSGKRENMLSDTNEYISLDKLGSQHACDTCNTRFSDLSLLDDHKKRTGHSQSLVPSSSNLLPYSNSTNLISSLLPVKHLADQVTKLSSIGNNSGFTHQQNVMINIQAYPGASGAMLPGQPPPYNSFQNATTYSTPSNMYGANGPPVSGNYSDSNIAYGQYPSQGPKPAYPGTMAPSSFPTQSPYSANGPLQAMEQAVYGQSGMMNQAGRMGPLGALPLPSYPPVSSPSGLVKSPGGSGLKIHNVQTFPPGQISTAGQGVGQMPPPPSMMYATVPGGRARLPNVRLAAQKHSLRAGFQMQGQMRAKAAQRMPLKRQGGTAGGPGNKRRSNTAIPGKHDSEGCQIMTTQKPKEGLALIHNMQGARDKLGSQIVITKKTVNKEANAMANVLASRGISIKQKQRSRSPTPERPIPHIPNLGAGVSIKHTSKVSNFSIPEAKVGGGMTSCKICRKMFGSQSSLQVHLASAHPQSKLPMFRCDECPASYPKSLQLQHHKRVFHTASGPNKELGLPVVDFSQADNLKKLSSLGVYTYIPLANREQADGSFGIPILSVHNMNSGLISSLQALGADGLLSLGPLKPLPNT